MPSVFRGDGGGHIITRGCLGARGNWMSFDDTNRFFGYAMKIMDAGPDIGGLF
jgi:hypothetical protein